MLLRITALIIFLFSINLLLSQEQETIITTFSRQNGLPPMKIRKMATDSSGQLWIGSNTGLHRFDGNQFHTFNTLPKRLIADIEVGTDGTVYIALVQHGLAIYNEEENDFSTIEHDEVFRNGQGKYLSILVQESGKVLLSQNGTGIYEVDKDARKLHPIFEKKYIEYILDYPLDEDKIILVADRLHFFNLITKELSLITSSPIVDATVDANGIIWYSVYEESGLNKYNFETKQSRFFSSDSLGAIFDNGLTVLDHEIWIASEQGIRVFDTETSIFRDLFKDYGSVTGIEVDGGGRLWFGQDNALHLINPQNQFFRFLTASKGKTYTDVSRIGEDRFLLAPFYDDHLEELDVSTGELRLIELPKQFADLAYPLDLAEIKDKIYIAYNNGILTFDKGTGKIEKIDFQNYSEEIENFSKKHLFVGDDGSLWISAIGLEVLYKVDTKTGDIDTLHYAQFPEEFPQNVTVLRDGRIIQCTERGLMFLDFENRDHEFFPFQKNGDTVNIGYIDDFLIEDENIWLLSESIFYEGVFEGQKIRLRKEIDNSTVFSYSLGLSLKRAEDGDIVILTSGGINIYDPSTSEIIPFGVDEGLINVDRMMRMEQFGDLFFFLSEGISYARKSDLLLDNYSASVKIEKLEVNGQNVYGQESYVFPYSSNDIKITFQSVDLTKPLDVKYKYRISEDNPWIYKDYDDNELLLLDLKAGSYEFEVSAKHLYSDWSPTERLSFRIKQAIWKRWWFVLVTILGAVLLGYYYYISQLKKTKEIANLKTRMVELENEALRAQMNPHFIFNSLNSIKSYIIDHDKEDAADYLTDFSDLIRLILANSREKFIPIERELEALKLYMDIENIRLEDKFQYKISNSVKSAYIQPLTLQPFIENAIWHGFVHKKDIGHLKIDIVKKESGVRITIEDDGVGRARSKKIEQKHNRKRSFGILITKERLSQSDSKNIILITDLFSPNGEGRGTRVEINIPYINSL